MYLPKALVLFAFLILLLPAAAEERMQVILIANHTLNDSELQQIRDLNATILKNFTLASWYEIEASSSKIAEIEKLDFVKEIKPAKEYKPLINGTKTDADENNPYAWIVPAIALILIIILCLSRKQKIMALILLFLLFLPSISFADGKIDSRILSSDTEIVSIIVEMEDGSDPQYLQALELKKFKIGNFYSMKIRKSEISKLEKMGVKKASLETEYKPLLNVAVPLINTSSFWNIGYNGSGIKVCVIDTGINKTHSALISRVVAEKDFVTTDSDGDNPADFDGHGTHVSGIVASNDSTYRGVAFGSSILNAKVFNVDTGGAPVGAIISGIDWCISQNASILTLSLGGRSEQNDGSDILSQYVDLTVDEGKVVTVSAGNSGPTGDVDCRTSMDSSGSSYSTCLPGLAHKVITVGSTESGKSGTTADLISGFSSRGPTNDSRIKPDVTAPGQPITSASLSGGWVSGNGTSMAAPMVAGLAALMLQARNITPEEVKALLMNTAVDLGTAGKDNTYGAGRINASRVFNEINNTARATISAESRVHNIFVSNSSEIRATLYWPESYSLHNNIDLYLLDPAGNVKAYSSSVNNTDEMIVFSNTSAGNWKLLVNPVNVSGSQVYAIAANPKPSEQMHLISNISQRVAYHQVNVTSNSTLKINLDWNSTDVNMDLYVYNTSGWLVNYSNATNTNYEEVSVNAESGIWLARLVTNQSSAYSLSSNFSVSQQILDNVSPTVAIIEPTNRTYAAQNISLSFSVAENMNAVVSCYATIDNSTTPLGYVKNFSVYNFSASDGTHSIYATCLDGANNTGNSTVINFTVDATAPNITFVSPSDANNSFVSRNYTFINVTVADSNLDICILEWNSANYTMTKVSNGSSAFCFLSKADSDGTYAYRILANDSAGNVNATARVITLDTTLPSATVAFSGGYNNTFSPNGDGVFDTITFNITASETVTFGTTYLLNSSNTTVKWFNTVANTSSIRKGPWDGFCTPCNATASDGTYKIEIKMTDRAGNINATNLTETIILDTTPPSISFVNPSPNNETLNVSNSIFVNITTSEATAALLELNGTNWTMNGTGTSWFKINSSLADGNYTFRVHVNDSIGNRNVSETRWVFINATRNMTSAISNINQTLSARNITVTILDSAGNMADSNRLLSFGNYTLRFNISNILVETADFIIGNLNASAPINITKDIAAELNVSNAFNQSGGIMDSYVWVDLNNLLPAGNFTAKITFPRTYAIYFYLNGTRDAPNMTRAANCNANVSNKPCYNISANASVLYLPSFSGGAGGNDTQAPPLSASSPTSTTYSSSSISLAYSVSDNVAIDKCWYRLNSGLDTTLTDCANATITAADGSNTLVVYANDTSGNMNQTSVTFTYTPPPTTPPSSGSNSIVETKNNTNATPAAPKKEELTETALSRNQTFINQTPEAQIKNETAGKNQSGIGTGLVIAFSSDFIISSIAVLVIVTVFILWKFKYIRKRFMRKRKYKKIRYKYRLQK